MTVEQCRVEPIHKPWGRNNLQPWYRRFAEGLPIGELWFKRPGVAVTVPDLLLKLLFTDAPLSFQVHPNDQFAKSIGLPNGKTEAWYVLAARPDARVALGLKVAVSPPQLQAAILDGSIADLVDWRPVAEGDRVFVPAGTIHAIGAGLVIAEVQQNSDATFRLFDYDRGRSLDVENAMAVALPGPAPEQADPILLTDARTLLVSNDLFSVERVCLQAHSTWQCSVRHETWLLVLHGSARANDLDLTVGDAVFLEDDSARIAVGSAGMKCLLAYVGGKPQPSLECEANEFGIGPSPEFSLEPLT